jgi:adenosylcobinamide-GDP ribazoletransferase
MRGEVALRDLAGAVHFFPIVGALVGVIGAIVYTIAGFLHLPSFPAALLALLAMIVVTGALHEDGLADTADALGAWPDRERALDAMRDSRLGTFGVIALFVSLMLRLGALSSFWEPLHFAGVLVCAAAASRAAMPAVMLVQPSVRPSGLAAAAGRPERDRVLIGIGIAAALSIAFLPLVTAVACCIVAAITGTLAAAALGRRFGGCTGDTLGAVQQCVEVAFLLTAVAMQ